MPESCSKCLHQLRRLQATCLTSRQDSFGGYLTFTQGAVSATLSSSVGLRVGKGEERNPGTSGSRCFKKCQLLRQRAPRRIWGLTLPLWFFTPPLALHALQGPQLCLQRPDQRGRQRKAAEPAGGQWRSAAGGEHHGDPVAPLAALSRSRARAGKRGSPGRELRCPGSRRQ